MGLPTQVLSLCSEYGGLDLGLRIATGAETVCYVERESYPASVIVARMADEALGEAPVWDDLKTFDGEPWRGKVDCITDGYPCQPFSHAGRRGGVEDERHIWPDMCRIISSVRPVWCFFENVEGHLSLGFREVVADLHELGYVVEAGLFTASEVGASHRRKRLFILANSSRPNVPQSETGEWDRTGGSVTEPSQDLGHSGVVGRTGNPRRRTGKVATDGHSGVADTRNGQLQVLGDTKCGGSESGRFCWPPPEITGTGRFSIFAPGPSDPRWPSILRDYPELAPAISKEAAESCIRDLLDGATPELVQSIVACRSDELRCLGNGVSPYQGAYAFSILFQSLIGEFPWDTDTSNAR